MDNYGLIGRKLGHSYSYFIHKVLGGYMYCMYELEPEELEAFVTAKGVRGYNVTIPYKKDVMQYLDVIDEKAQMIGSVNTVVNRGGRLYGYNTDCDGMVYMLDRAGIELQDKVVMILGTGGTSSTAQAVARQKGAREVIVVSRTGAINYTNCYDRQDTQIIINTTPVGMYPNVDGCPINIALFPGLIGVADVVYNPENTMLVATARALGIRATSGLSMLVAQAAYAKELFTGKAVSDSDIEAVLRELKMVNRNVILIGMPGAGKSTIGKEVAAMLGKTFVDVDEEIVRSAGMSIPQIFATHGEAYFRQLEKQITMKFSIKNSLVIATGGGVVLDRSNRNVLRYNGIVVEIARPLDRLATEGRPLSKDMGALTAMYEKRKPLYESFRDGVVCNDGDIDSAVKGVIEIYENSCN